MTETQQPTDTITSATATIHACDSGLPVEDYLTDTFWEITDDRTSETLGYAITEQAANLFSASPLLLSSLQLARAELVAFAYDQSDQLIQTIDAAITKAGAP